MLGPMCPAGSLLKTKIAKALEKLSIGKSERLLMPAQEAQSSSWELKVAQQN
jgi:hypothetical protein